MGSQQFCLKWNNHQSNMLTVFDQLLATESFVDVTIACDGFSLKAHKMVLSACSPYFQKLFVDNPCQHPIVILKDIRYDEMKAIIDFMYKGEVNVSQEQLAVLLKTAEALKVKGLAEVTGHGSSAEPPSAGHGSSAEPLPSSSGHSSSVELHPSSSSSSQMTVHQPLATYQDSAGGRASPSFRRKRKAASTTKHPSRSAPAESCAVPSLAPSASDDCLHEARTPVSHDDTTASETFGFVQETVKEEELDDQLEANDVAETTSTEDIDTEQMDYSNQDYGNAADASSSSKVDQANVRLISVYSASASGAASNSSGGPSTSTGCDGPKTDGGDLLLLNKRLRSEIHQVLDNSSSPSTRHMVSINRAASELGLSRRTARKLMRDGFLSRRRGPKPILSEEEEMAVVDYICSYHVCGLGLQPKRTDIINYACALLQSRVPSDTGLPAVTTVGKKWWATFRRRHPELEDFIN